MQHNFKNICYDVDYLFNGTKTLGSFMNKLRNQAEKHQDSWMHDPDKYFGDGFEALIECVINTLGYTPKIQIKDYTPVQENDMGVDGFGYGPDGEIHTVQIKARGNTDSVLTANRDHISNFVAHSLAKYNAKHMTIFTTAKTLHEAIASDMYMDKVRTVGNENLRSMIDNNVMFWSQFRNMLKYEK